MRSPNWPVFFTPNNSQNKIDGIFVYKREMITFFFVRDYQHKYRFFSSEPPKPLPAKFSKTKQIWEIAKKKLMLLPQKTLRQEQAFGRALKLQDPALRIIYSGFSEEKRINLRFRLFLNGHRTKRLLILIGEALILPFAGLAMFLPGPNIAFYALALMMITHWQSLRGIRRILKKGHDFDASPVIAEWEEAVKDGNEEAFPSILEKMAREHNLENIQKVLWK